MNPNRSTYIVFIVFLIVFTTCYDVVAYKADTHRNQSSTAVENSILVEIEFLNSIGIHDLNEKFNLKTIDEWIKHGADKEDTDPRYLNHFHNPLKPWSDAGLNDFFSGESSLLWSQDGSNEFSWQSTRQNYYNALTLSSKASRDVSFGKVFKGLGHLIGCIRNLLT